MSDVNNQPGTSSVEENDESREVTLAEILAQHQELNDKYEEEYIEIFGGSDDKNCSYSQGYVKRQALYACLTCTPDARSDPTKRAGVCLACSYNCHYGHEMIELCTKRNFRCDCGTAKIIAVRCKLDAVKLEQNDKNSYNQNFSGLYCICHRPYPDPEDSIDDEMVQCVLCEDWFHFRHLVPTAVDLLIRVVTLRMVGKVMRSSSDDEKHTGDATCLLFLNGYLYSGGADGKIKIWDANLQLVKEINAHDSYIYAICSNSKGVIYSSSCDGTIKYFENALTSNDSNVLMKTEQDEIISLICVEDVIYSGDDKGVVIKWVNNKILFKYNIVEEVRSVAVEKTLLYTARDLDCVITDLLDGKSGKYVTKATIVGRAPVLLFGPKSENGVSMFLVFTTRDGKGISLVRNKQPYDSVWNKEDAHEMIINTLCSSGSDTLYSAGYDGKVKKWIEVENSPQNAGEVSIGRFINAICMGLENRVYVADTTGVISEVCFSPKAG